MTIRSRPVTDYKKTALMIKYIHEYDELSSTLMEMLQELGTKTLEGEELDKLTAALEEMSQEMEKLVFRITQYGGKV